MSMKTIKLAHGVPRRDGGDQPLYKVLVVKNTTWYHPGEILDRDKVETLCNSSDWDVTIVSLNTNNN